MNSNLKIVLVILILHGCGTNEIEMTVDDFNSKLGASDKSSYYLFIPYEGCYDCVKKLMEFAEKNESNNLICFIIVTSGSKIAISSKLINSKNCVIDTQLISIREGWISKQPMLYSVQKNLRLRQHEILVKNIDEELNSLQIQIDLNNSEPI